MCACEKEVKHETRSLQLLNQTDFSRFLNVYVQLLRTMLLNVLKMGFKSNGGLKSKNAKFNVHQDKFINLVLILVKDLVMIYPYLD